MPPERGLPDDPREWLNRARSNLGLAKQRIEDAYLEDLCFEAQQAAAKALKAVLIDRQVNFPYVHDLGRLVSLLQEAGVAISEDVQQADQLTRFAVVTRYPGLAEPVSEQLYAETLAIAERVVRWAEEEVRQSRGR